MISPDNCLACNKKLRDGSAVTFIDNRRPHLGGAHLACSNRLKPSRASDDRFDTRTIDDLLSFAGMPLSLDRLQEYRATPASRLDALITERDRLRRMVEATVRMTTKLAGSIRDSATRWPNESVEAQVAEAHALAADVIGTEAIQVLGARDAEHTCKLCGGMIHPDPGKQVFPIVCYDCWKVGR